MDKEAIFWATLHKFLKSQKLKKTAKALAKEREIKSDVESPEFDFLGQFVSQSAPSSSSESASSSKSASKKRSRQENDASEEPPAKRVKESKSEKDTSSEKTSSKKKKKEEEVTEKTSDLSEKSEKKKEKKKKKEKAAKESSLVQSVEAAVKTVEAPVQSDENAKSKKKAKHAETQPFRRIKEEEIEIEKDELKDNTYYAKRGDSWGYKANQDLEKVKGRDFRHEKTKKKRGSYKGGPIDMGVNSIKFESSDDDN